MRVWRLAVLLSGAGWVEFKAADFFLTDEIWQNLRLWETGNAENDRFVAGGLLGEISGADLKRRI
jgi:hypothetical protein